MDFMSDVLSDGCKICVLNIMDDYNWEVLVIEVGLSFLFEWVVWVL